MDLKKDIEALIKHGKLLSYVSNDFLSSSGKRYLTRSRVTKRRSYLGEGRRS